MSHPCAIGAEAVDRISMRMGAQRTRQIAGRKGNGPRVYVVQYPEGTDLAPILAAYRASAAVVHVEADAMGHGGGDRSFVPNDPYYFRQWGLKNDGSFSLFVATPGADIDMESAWEIEQGSPDVVVAIIDSGTRLQHPEFEGRLWINAGEIPGNGMDDDGNGFVDDVYGWDFANVDNDPTDDQGHGTNVAGIVGAAGNNDLAYTGVDLNCKLMSLKALNSANQGYYSWWIEAMYYAVDNGANIMNMSLGGTLGSPEMQTAVDYALQNNVMVVACMMNTNSSVPYIPAALNGVFSVGATSPNDRRAVPFPWSSSSGSNFGPHIDVIAPGNYTYGLNHLSNTAINTYWSGTSQAAPHVAGVAALLIAQDPTRTVAEIAEIIRSTADDQVGDPLEDVAGWDPYHGHGRLNAFNALSISVGIAEPARTAHLQVYPNPNNGTFSLRAQEAGLIEIHDELGRKVHEKRVQAGENIFTPDLAPGLYIVRSSAATGPVALRMIVQ